MKFGVRLANSGPLASPGSLTTMAKAAEDLGYDAISVHDHVNWGPDDRYHFYAGSIEAADAADAPYDFYSAFSTMAYLAAITHRVRIIPAAMCLAWRHPLIVAREASTLHELSEGRFVLGVCPGNVRRDFEVTATPWEQRGRLTEESLQILRAAIDRDEPISFQGELIEFERAMVLPRPSGLQLWYGGTSKVALRRAAQYCDGWMPGGGPAYFREVLPRVYELAEAHGRGGRPFEAAMISRLHVADTTDKALATARKTLEYQSKAEWLKRHDLKDIEATWLVGDPERVAEGIAAIEAAGVSLVLHTIIGHSMSEILDQMHRFAEDVMPLNGQREK